VTPPRYEQRTFADSDPHQLVPRHSVIFGDTPERPLYKTSVTDVDFVNCDLTNCDLGSAELTRVTFTGCDLTDVYMVHANLSDVTFSNCTVDGAYLIEARLDRVSVFPASDWDKILLSDAYLSADSDVPPSYCRNNVSHWAANLGPLPYDPVTWGVFDALDVFRAPAPYFSERGTLIYDELHYDRAALPKEVMFLLDEHYGLPLATAKTLSRVLVAV
jgi:hypothetical protein